jgi:hypothetical protein
VQLTVTSAFPTDATVDVALSGSGSIDADVGTVAIRRGAR